MSQVIRMPGTGSLAIPVNRVLKNTYLLLSIMFVISAAVAGLSMAAGIGRMPWWLSLPILIGLPLLIHLNRNSAIGLLLAFAFAGLLGLIAGPVIGNFAAIDPTIPMYAFAATAVVFFALSAYALLSRKDFSFLGGFVFAGFIVVLLAFFAALFLQMPILWVAISAACVLLASCGILYSTSAMALGGETNYVVIATSLFADLWVLFMHLMNLFGVFSLDD